MSLDAAVIEAGLDFDIGPKATLGISYNGQIASKARDHGVKADQPYATGIVANKETNILMSFNKR